MHNNALLKTVPFVILPYYLINFINDWGKNLVNFFKSSCEFTLTVLILLTEIKPELVITFGFTSFTIKVVDDTFFLVSLMNS
jgi:hypothetical protein